jgi:hypothetical protein
MYYVDKLLLSENHVFFTVMILLGLPFCWKHLGFRYIVVLLATLWTLHTNFLAALAPRYCYYFQPLVIVGGVAATVMLYDRVLALAQSAGNSSIGRFAAHATGLILLALLFIQSNETILKTYQLSITGDTPQMMTRLNTYRYDYRGVARYVMEHARPGDVIFPGIPHVFNFYAGVPAITSSTRFSAPRCPTINSWPNLDSQISLPACLWCETLRNSRAWSIAQAEPGSSSPLTPHLRS